MQKQNFVLSRSDRIGDLVLALPALGFLHQQLKKDPVRKPFLWLHHSQYTHDVAQLALFNGLCDGLWTSAEKAPFEEKNPYFVSLQHNDGVQSDLAKIGRKNSIGPRTKLSCLWTYAQTMNQKRSRVLKSEMEYNVELVEWALEKWGFASGVFQGLPALLLPPEWKSPLLSQEVSVVLSNRGSAGNWSWDDWLKKFESNELATKGIDFLYYGSLEQEAKDFFKDANKKIPNFRLLVNPFSKVSELAVYLKSAKKVYASSTGPLHLAHALGVSVHGVYPSYESSRVQSFKRWRPDGYWHSAAVSYETLEGHGR